MTSINNNAIGAGAESKSKFWQNNKKIVVGEITSENPTETLECKYCMLGENAEEGEFLCKPCKCSGTCGLVHFHCL